MSPDLRTFDADDLGPLGDTLRSIRGLSMEEAARAIVGVLHEELRDGRDGSPACALVRLYKTHAFGGLGPDLQAFARGVAGHDLAPDVRCLTLLATAGSEPEWNATASSRGHRAIPLTSEGMVERAPMILGLVTQFGLAPAQVVAPEPGEVGELALRTYEAFHVQEAPGSPLIPAQEDFVVPYGIRSALGFGGVLYTGDFYAVILFSRVEIDPAAARTLRVLALAVRVPLLAFARGPVFDAQLV